MTQSECNLFNILSRRIYDLEQLMVGAIGTGTVTIVSVAAANGFIGTVATATSTPSITIIAGDITPSSVTSTGAISGTNGTFSGEIVLPNKGPDTDHGPAVFKNVAGSPFGTAGTLVGVTATTTNNSTAATLSAGHGVTVGQFVTIGAQAEAFYIAAVAGNNITLGRVATATAAGQAVNYIQVNDHLTYLGSNIGRVKTTEPSNGIVFESDYLDGDGIRRDEAYFQFVSADGTVQKRPFFVAYNRADKSVYNVLINAGTRGFYVLNSAETRNIAAFAENLIAFDRPVLLTHSDANQAKFTVDGTAYGAFVNNVGYNFNIANDAVASVQYGRISVQNVDRTTGAEAGRMDFAVTISGDTTARPFYLTGSGATVNGTLAVTGATTMTGALTSNGALISVPQLLSGAGAVNVTTLITKLTSTGIAEALTLADGVNGQMKTIIHAVDGGSSILAPTTATGFATITFTMAGHSATLVFFTTQGWIIQSIYGAVAA